MSTHFLNTCRDGDSNVIILYWDMWSTLCPSSSFSDFEIACCVLEAYPNTVNHRAETEFFLFRSTSVWSVKEGRRRTMINAGLGLCTEKLPTWFKWQLLMETCDPCC